ncbi:hypothetical protein ASG25_09425 [Rhizobium sp. Leaf384]|uniref:sensor histidine kinase n=1 Tax=Rhizobium sp. Leaf384 TaxID=1736358 RepID=UPI000715F2F1|nr:histidine kinase dimerization/phosphoacceptor domain -containing protein [Rhizobium sp. Leaf384]KQS78841.1 hypothetical protein ASG25_09425 [Rhizobium sp. Leaf384]
METPDLHEELSPRPAQVPPQEELAYRLRQQRLLAGFGYFALAARACDTLLQEATRVAASGLRVCHSKVLEHRGDGAGFTVVAGVGWHAGVVGKATVGDDLESPAGYAFHSAKAVISNHLANEQRFRTPSLLVEHGITRAINVIIQTEQARYGVLEVDSPIEGSFDEHDVTFLDGLAALLGVAIQRDRREHELRVSESALKAAAAFQEVLTQEVSHRVKNSLSIVAGLLSMQARTSVHPEVAQALRSAGRRVGTVAAVHDRLWRNNQSRAVDLRDFLSDLSEQLTASASGSVVVCRSVGVEVSTEQAVTVGLLVNELVTNAFKYAYGEDGGEVIVELSRETNGRLRLSVSDLGKGLPTGFETTDSGGLGLKLIRSLSAQLGGLGRWTEGDPGTVYELDFLPAPAEIVPCAQSVP